MLLELLWHWWKGDTLWQIWERVNEPSFFVIIVIEGASFAELAFSSFSEVFARLSFVVRVNCAEGSLTEVLWERL